ncbi:MarR family EPS-associated transcriptional regulator [Spiribacter sp. 221]|uniref:MarR family EPS-associated transcriptional regulator n=1 Tax=Spiribacter onubensis TaxID=3122420 RepID=UPI00349F7DF1
MSRQSPPGALEEDLARRALEALHSNPELSQRALADELGISVGKANHCLRALVDKGLVKLQNFHRNPKKLRYIYLLTPQGIEEKTRMTWRFLRRKEAEYEALQAEIAELRASMDAQEPTSNKG